MIFLENISKKYETETVVKNFTHKVEKGKTTVLIGPSGCGKSTLMRLITGLTNPTEGRITFENEKLTSANLLNIRRKIGYVIQEGGLFPHLTGLKNVTLIANHLKWDESKIDVRVNELCELTSLNYELLQNFPAQLSGGQRQRVSLMRALMLDPKYLLLDEPLGALDPLVRYDLQNDLKEIFNRLNKTVLMVTHDLTEAVFFADEIILMREGEIIQKGEPNKLIVNPADDFVEKFINAQRGHLKK
jgi:osmoprotectant transport system ATP-binding protein